MRKAVPFCPLCQSGRSKLFDRREFKGQEVVNRLCLDCGMVYQSPRMDEEETATFYASEYRLLNEGSTAPTSRNSAVQQARAEHLASFVRPKINTLNRHLDIGCSMGMLLKQFVQEYHCQPFGIEPGDAHRKQAQEHGLIVFASIEELEKDSEASFDLISMSHVLEHLSDPIGTLTHLRESLMSPDGWLLVEVPNLYVHDSFEVAHTLAFSEHTLKETFRQSGFEVVQFKKHGIPNSALLELFMTALCRAAESPDLAPIRPEHRVTVKRKAGMVWRHVLERINPQQAWLK